MEMFVSLSSWEQFGGCRHLFLANSTFKSGQARQVQKTCSFIGRSYSLLPAAVIGLFFDDWFEAHFYNLVSVSQRCWAPCLSGKGREHEGMARQICLSSLQDCSCKLVSFHSSSFLGLAALVPQLLYGLLMVCQPVLSTEFIFYLGIPIVWR